MQLIQLQESRAAIPIFHVTKALVGYLASTVANGSTHFSSEHSVTCLFTTQTDQTASCETAVLLCSSASGHLTPVPIHTRHRHLVLQVKSCREVSQTSEAEASGWATWQSQGALRGATACVCVRDDSGSKLHFDLKSEEKRVLFANQNASISSFEGLPNKLLQAKGRHAESASIRSTRL